MLVIIEDKNLKKKTDFERVLEYRMDGRAFYVAGTDFESWYILEGGDLVTVVEEE